MTWIDDLAARADALLPDYVSAYYHSSAGDGSCDREGIADWNAFRLRPTVLRDASAQDLSSQVLGTPVAAPILVAPMAQQVGARPEGEVLTAQGARQAGTLLGVSTNTGAKFSDIAAQGAPWWYQVYVARNRDATRLLVERAAKAEAKAIVLTVDTTPLGRENAAIDPRNWPQTHRKNRTANLTDDELDRFGSDTDMALDLTPDTIGWLGEVSGLPVLCKGVLTARDARRCVDAGADGIIVSTHGGRRLGNSVTSAHALPEILAEVGGEAEVHVDSGIRGGAQAAVALALGAKAVHIGRPVMWGLAADGAAGVANVLATYQAELVTTLRQMGIGSVRDLAPSDVVLRGVSR